MITGTTPPAPRRSGRAPWKLLSSLLLLPLAAALLVAGVVCRQDAPTDLARIQPLPPAILAEIDSLGSWPDALSRYRSARYEEVEASLHGVTNAAPDDPAVFLLLGSAQLLQAHGQDALLSLRLAAGRIREETLRRESGWQLAQAYLMTGQHDSAANELYILAQKPGTRHDDAEQMLASLRDAGIEREP